MKILSQRILQGPNVYHWRPVIATLLDLQEKAEVGSHSCPEFVERLLALLPGLWEHACSPGYRGGFVERLHRGTYFAHIVEHVALELSELAGVGVDFGKSVYAGSSGRYLVITRFRNAAAMISLVKTAVELSDAVFAGQGFDPTAPLAAARALAEETGLGPTTQALAEAAERRGIPWRRIGDGSLLELGYGKYRRRLQAAVTDGTSLVAADIAQDKGLTKQILSSSGIPVPEGRVARTPEEATEAFARLHPPLAVKPLSGHQGIGVSLNIANEPELLEAFETARRYDGQVVIERMISGRDYRVLVVREKLAAAAERFPPSVVGDGLSTVEKLIDDANKDPRRLAGHGGALTKIDIDAPMIRCLARQGLLLESRPERGRRVVLRDNANLSTGGSAVDVTDRVHPGIREICERAARAIGLDVCGVDLVHGDIARPPDDGTAIIEVNAGPGLRMHLCPSAGSSRDVAGAVIETVFPVGAPSRVPIIAVTGTNGKTTTVRIISHILRSAGLGKIGVTTSDGISIDGRVIVKGDTTGPRSAHLVLADPSVDAAVLEVARGGIVRDGLAYDWSDVGLITNIRPDHLGQDGIEDVADLARIKSLVAERVREGGTIVLNADDPEASRLMDRPRLKRLQRRVFYYSTGDQNPLIRAHIERDGGAFYIENGVVFEARAAQARPLIRIEDIPFTLRGRAGFQVANALGAIAACRALGVGGEQVAAGLRTFENARENQGRMTVFRVARGLFILDYAHNPDALAAMGELLRGFNRRVTAILGLPGDRSDALIVEAAKTATRAFDRLIVREDLDLRGREPGELPAMIARAAREERPDGHIRICLREEEATREAVDSMMGDEIVVLFYEKYEASLGHLAPYQPVLLDRPEDAFFTAPACVSAEARTELYGHEAENA